MTENILDPHPLEPVMVAIRRALRNVHTSLPGTIVTYNPLLRTAEIILAVALEKSPGEFVPPTPPIPDVPVLWPGGQLGSFHVDLLPGDHVLVVFTEQDPSGWEANGVPAMPPPLVTRHGLYAYAIPGCFNSTTVLPTTGVWCSATGVALGEQTAVSPVTLDVALKSAVASACAAAVAGAVPNDGGKVAFGIFASTFASAVTAAVRVRAV